MKMEEGSHGAGSTWHGEEGRFRRREQGKPEVNKEYWISEIAGYYLIFIGFMRKDNGLSSFLPVLHI